MIKSLLKDKLESYNIKKSEPVALLLSGGLDSFTLAICLKELGYTVNSYTFYLKDNYSYDAEKAKEISEQYLNLNSHTEIEIDASDDTVVYSVLIDLIRTLDIKSKTLVECVYPHVYMIPEIEETYVFAGNTADTHFGSTKNATLAAKRSQDEFNELRYKSFFGESNIDKQGKYFKLYELHNKKLLFPWFDRDTIYNYFIQKTWEEIHTPNNKGLVRQDFEDYLENIKVKPHWNYQKCAGICDVFENHFLNNPKYNSKQRIRMMDVYRDWHTTAKSQSLESMFM